MCTRDPDLDAETLLQDQIPRIEAVGRRMLRARADEIRDFVQEVLLRDYLKILTGESRGDASSGSPPLAYQGLS